MTVHDLDAVIALQLRALPEETTSRLGPRFLRTLYQEALREGEIAIVADTGAAIVGYALGSLAPRKLLRSVYRQHLAGVGLAAGRLLWRRPARLASLVRKQLSHTADPGSAGATLMYLASTPDERRRGVGRRLVEGFLREAELRGASSVDLVTRRDGNDAGHRFYAALGFTAAGEVASAEAVKLEYRKILPTRDSPAPAQALVPHPSDPPISPVTKPA